MSRGARRGGKQWSYRYIFQRREEFHTLFTRAYDFQRALCVASEPLKRVLLESRLAAIGGDGGSFLTPKPVCYQADGQRNEATAHPVTNLTAAPHSSEGQRSPKQASKGRSLEFILDVHSVHRVLELLWLRRRPHDNDGAKDDGVNLAFDVRKRRT